MAATKSKPRDGVVDDPSGVKAPAENAPGPEPVEPTSLHAVDLRPRIEPQDRATFLGAVHKRDEDTKVPEKYFIFGDSDGERDKKSVDLKGKPVDVFQVIGTNSTLALRIDGETFIFNAEQARALSIDFHGVSTNVVT